MIHNFYLDIHGHIAQTKPSQDLRDIYWSLISPKAVINGETGALGLFL